jgi:hypothetical protein
VRRHLILVVRPVEQKAIPLLLHRFYGASESETVADIQELKSRGWSPFKMRLCLFLFIPLIAVERVVASLGGDNWCYGPPSPKDILFSFVFSVFLVTSIPGSIYIIMSLFGGDIKVISGIFVLFGIFSFLPVWRKA